MHRAFIRVVCVLLCSLLLVLQGCTPQQKPIRDSQGVPYFLNQVEDSSRHNRWQEAETGVRELEAAWERDRDRLTTNRTKENVKRFEASLEELKENVEEQDEEDVVEEVKAMRGYYRNITEP